MRIIEIDGAHGEAGGQILRTALSLSAVTQKPFRIFNIRSSRPVPGLQPQHIKSVEACAAMCDATVMGNEKNSTEITFMPKKIKSGIFEFDIGTAGSVTLLLQSLLPIAIYAKDPVQIMVKGGTDVKWSPPIKYFQHIFCYYMHKIGINAKVHIKKYGFYPKGGGEVLMEVKPSSIKEIDIQRTGVLQRIDVHSIASTTLEKSNVAGRQVDGFIKNIGKTNASLVKNKFIEYVATASIGSSLHCHAHYEHAKIGASALGEPGFRSEIVGALAAQHLIKQMKALAPFDEYMEDQIIPYMALSTVANNKSSIIRIAHLTKHTETNMWVVEHFLPVKFELGKNVLECNLIQ